MNAEATMDTLPEDLKLEILLRLPIRSLVSLKRVSKSWHSIISNPNFAKLHLQQSTHSQHPNRVLQLNYAPRRMRSIDIRASLHNDSSTLQLFCRAYQPHTDIQIIDSCRGIVLLHTGFRIWMWNPTTGAHKCISHLPPQARLSISAPFAFCYDESLDDYFIGLSYLPHPQYSNGIGNYEIFEVLSMRNNSWDKLDLNRHFATLHRNRGTIFKGAMHFMVHEAHRDGSKYSLQRIVIAYDVTNKDLRKVATPPIYANLNLDCAELGVIEGCLALTCPIDTEVQLWMMKEYGVVSTWTKLISVPAFHQAVIDYNMSFLFVKEGDEYVTTYITIDGCEGLSRWNDKGELIGHRSYGHKLRQRRQFRGSWLREIEYTETLLPLP